MEPEAGYVNLTQGDPAPWFYQKSSNSPRFAFDTVGGRYIVLCFFSSASNAHARALLDAVDARAVIFDDTHASFFGVSNDPVDLAEKRVCERIPGRRFFWDFDGAVSRLYGVLPKTPPAQAAPEKVQRRWFILDPSLRIAKTFDFRADGGDIKDALDFVAALPPPGRHAGFEISAPIIILPNMFEASFCARLIDLYNTQGGEESGFMREQDGKTMGVYDHSHKQRKDCLIEDQTLLADIRNRVMRRAIPEIRKVHQFQVTRMERYVVACYAAEDGGHFRQHRDNTTKGTAHRRFAMSVLLNDDYEGGEISFPEYGDRGYKPAAGGAVIFSCSLLHKVAKVTAGRRYVFLPFLYDDTAARQREENNAYLGENVGTYRLQGGPPEPGQ